MTNIRVLREKHNLTRPELGAIIGVSPSTINGWEWGLRTPEMASAMKMADLFEVSLDYLMGRSTA